jgi:hypothetical protein
MLVNVGPETVSTTVDSDRAVRDLAKVIAPNIVVQVLPKKVSTVVDTFSTTRELAKLPGSKRADVVQAIAVDVVRSQPHQMATVVASECAGCSRG